MARINAQIAEVGGESGAVAEAEATSRLVRQFADGAITFAEMAQRSKELTDALHKLAEARKEAEEKRKAEEADRRASDDVKRELDKLKTKADVFREYRDKLDAWKAGGRLSDGQETELLRRKMKELMGKGESPDTGRRVDSASRWSEIQSAVLKPKDETAEETLREIAALKAEIVKMNRDGLTIKG
jgi:Ni/Co efflux regulator RcnB